MSLNRIKINESTVVNTGIVYDIRKATNQTYETLADALGTDGNNVPTEVREGGMSVRYVQTSDNKYVQYRLMSDTFSTMESDWQGVDDEPTAGSDNFVKSSGIIKQLLLIPQVTLGSTAWIFEYKLKTGKEYYAKLLNENIDAIGLGLGASIIATLERNKWVNFVSPGNGKPYWYFSSSSVPEKPEIIIAEKNAILTEFLATHADIDKNSENITTLTALVNNNTLFHLTAEAASTSWMFTEFKVEQGVKYYVMAANDAACNVYINIGATQLVILNNTFQEIIPTRSDYLYIYTPSGPSGVEPEIYLIKECGLIDIINSLEDEIKTTNELLCVTHKGFKTSTSWKFIDAIFESGKTYYVKHISGYGNNHSLSVGSSVLETLKTGEWIKVIATETGYPYLYFGSQTVEQPVIEIASEESIIPEFDEISKFINKNDIISHTAEQGSTAWLFNSISFARGETCLIRLKNGYGDNRALSIGSTVGSVLHLGEWIEYIAPEAGRPYIYVGSGGSFGETPTIEVAQSENIILNETRPLEEDVKALKNGVKVNTINVSFDGTSKTGRTIYYSGLNAIADALNSITDASETNRYVIHVEGEFHFTDPLTVPMFGGSEYSVILMKPYVDIEGDGPDRSIIFVDFPANATFHEGKNFNDYQPIYFFGVGGAIRNMKIAGKNCRYCFHIEYSNTQFANDAKIDVENCSIVSYGAPDYQGDMSCLGTGITSGQIWNIKNCEIINYYGGSAFAMHTQLFTFKRIPVVNIINCTIRGYLTLHNYQVENLTKVNILDSTFTKGQVPVIYYSYYNNRNVAKHGDYTTIHTNANKLKALYEPNARLTQGNMKGCVLRIKSLSSGQNSKVRFDTQSTAFNSIIGDNNLTGLLKTPYFWNTQYGYVYRDGGVDLSGQAFGTWDIDENPQTGNSLGILLGDCTVNSKVLIIIIDDNNYNITFNEDYTSKTNAYIVEKINEVISSVAIADLFSPAVLYYPWINGMCEVISIDNTPILKGMGVVFEGNGMRKARNSDGRIDGICIDDTSYNQNGRVITEGFIHSSYHNTSIWVTTLDDLTVQPSAIQGQTLGIDPENDGKFKLGSTPEVLRCRQNYLQLL